jgi:predicted esterase
MVARLGRIATDRRRPPHRVAVMLATVVAAAVVTSGCLITSLPQPSGTTPLRYRDPVFTTIDTTSNLTYGSAPDLNGNPVSLQLDLYQPHGDTVMHRPAIVWVHGGSFSGGDKASGVSPFEAMTFAKLGYVTVSINYRLLAPSGCTGSTAATSGCVGAALDAIADAKAAVRWLRANAATYRIDTDRIGIGGESAGAIVATGVGVTADVPGDSGNPGFSSAVRGFDSISGGLPNGGGVDSSDSNGILFTGTADPIVPTQWSSDTANAMDKAGLLAELVQFPGAGHVPFAEDGTTITTQSEYFFYDNMDCAQADQ